MNNEDNLRGSTDILTIILASTPVDESDEINPGVIFDYDKEGNIVGLGILDASQRVENPSSMEFNVNQSSFSNAGHARNPVISYLLSLQRHFFQRPDKLRRDHDFQSETAEMVFIRFVFQSDFL